MRRQARCYLSRAPGGLSAGCYIRGVGRIHAEDLRDPELVYTASSLREARSVEAVLTSRGVEYAVQVEELGRTTLFGSIRHGAAFYVSAGQAAYCRTVLTEGGLTRGAVDPGE